METAVGGGSIVLFEGSNVIDRLLGASGVSRAEDLLPNIDELLRINNVRATDLCQIVVGAGPGSFTGIRIGIATASGLSASLGIPMRLISTLDAVARTAIDDEFLVVLPIGRDTVCMQLFSKKDGRISPYKKSEVVSAAALIDRIEEEQSRKFILYESTFSAVPVDLRSNLINCGGDLACYLGHAANADQSSDVAQPLFIGKQN